MWHSIWKRRPRRCVAEARRVRLGLERLEERAVPAALQTVTTVYTESNNPVVGQNAVLAFHQNPDGSLTQFASFNTGGTGQINVPKVIGPDDSSQEVIATPDSRFLFAVNQGSNTVSSFRIDEDGSLHLIGQFNSGGVQPDSLGIAGWPHAVRHQPEHQSDRQLRGWQPIARTDGGHGRHAERADRPDPPVHGRRSRRRPPAGHRGGH